MIELRKNASDRLECYFPDREFSPPVKAYLSAELGFTFEKPIHDPAFSQLYMDCVKDNYRLVYGYDEWFEGFFIFAWDEASDRYIQAVYERFKEQTNGEETG